MEDISTKDFEFLNTVLKYMSHDKEYTNAALVYTELNNQEKQKNEIKRGDNQVVGDNEMKRKINEMHEYLFGRNKHFSDNEQEKDGK